MSHNNFFRKSTLFFLLETNVQVSLKLLGLLMNAFKNLISIRIDIKVHFFIIMCGQLDWIIAQHIVNNIVIFKICRFSWNDMDHKMLDWWFRGCILNVNCGWSDVVITLKRLCYESYCKTQIEYLDWLKLTELFNFSFCGEQNIFFL